MVVPLTYARGMGPLPRLVTEQAGSKALARLFRDESLPASLADNADHQIPLASMGRLFSRSARAVGDPLFGLEIGNRMAPAEFGFWARYSAQGSTLGIALARLQVEHAEPGTELEIGQLDGHMKRLHVDVCSTPFVDPTRSRARA